MRVHVTRPTGDCPGHPTTTLVIDGELAIDAGSLGWFAPLADQARVRHVLLTHAHMDHVAGLPVFIDNVYQMTADPPTVLGTPATLAALQSHVFNDTLMPDFVELGRRMAPFFHTRPLAPGVLVTLGRYGVTPHAVDHTVPTVAFTIDDGTEVVAVVTDTAPVPDLIERLAAWPRLAGVYLEASFPARLSDLARLTKHLTTANFLAAAARFEVAGVPVYPIHVKPRHAPEVLAELRGAGRANVVLNGLS